MGKGVNRRRERMMAMPPIAGDICLLMEGDKEHVSDAEVDDGLVGLVLRGRKNVPLQMQSVAASS